MTMHRYLPTRDEALGLLAVAAMFLATLLA